MLKNLSSSWGGVRLPKYFFLIITAVLFISCDNFLNGLDAKNQLEDGISYANARSIEVLVNAAEGTGTTVPSGQYTAKSGYPFEVSRLCVCRIHPRGCRFSFLYRSCHLESARSQCKDIKFRRATASFRPAKV